MNREPFGRTWPYEASETFAGTRASVAEARRFVAGALAGTGFDVDAAAVAVSELATNAVVHSKSAFTKYDVWIGVWSGRTATVAQVLVVDEGPLEASERPAEDLERCGGLGLDKVVEHLTSDHGDYTHPATGCHVAWFRLTRPAARRRVEGVVPRG